MLYMKLVITQEFALSEVESGICVRNITSEIMNN